MSETDLRELERKWRETSSVEDEAAWLRARVRAGELAGVMVELAAFLGCAAAQDASGQRQDTRDSARVLLGLGDWGMQPLVRAAIALVWSDLSSLAPSGKPVVSWRAFELVEARFVAKGQLLLPQREVERELEDLVAGQEWERASQARSVRDLLQVIAKGPDPRTAAFQCSRGFGTSLPSPENEPEWRQQLERSEAQKATVGAELVPWALGYSDPVRDRVAERGQIGILPDELAE